MARIYKKGKTSLVSSILNILGLTAAFAALYIILVQVHHDLTYNKALKDSDRIYCMMVGDQFADYGASSWICRPIAEAVIAASPDVEAGGCAYIGKNCPTAYIILEDNRQMQVKIGAFSEGGKDVFGLELVAGNWDDWINGITYAVSESTAQRLGVQVGDVAKLRKQDWRGISMEDAVIVAIYKDMPANSDAASFDMCYNIGKQGLDNWSEWGYNYFVKLREGADPVAFDEAAKPAMKDANMRANGVDPTSLSEEEMAKWEESVNNIKLRLMKLTDTYFAKNINAPGKTGNRTTTMTLLAIAIVVVVIAFINYINFFFAMVPIRLRNINTRKILGSSRFSLVMSFVGESVTMVVIALALAVAVVTLFRQSTLVALIDTPLHFGQNWGIAALTVGSGLLVSVAASLYPALFATSFNPAFALKGTLGTTQKGKAFRIGLIGLQFTVSIALIICAIFVHEQRQFMLNRDMGFDKEQLLTVMTTVRIGYLEHETAENRLKADAAIKDVAWGDGPFVLDERMGWNRDFKGGKVHWQCYPVSWNFLDFMGIELAEGRDFTPSDEQSENGVYILNETAQKMYDIQVGDQIQGHTNGLAEVAGICKDFNYSALRNEIGPFALYVFGKNPWRPCMQLFVRTEAGVDVPAVMKRIQTILNELDPDIAAEDYDVQLFDQTLQSQYKKEQNLSKLITLFTILAIVISLMGVFGLVMFETEHRRKEIGIRRVHGATVGQILAMFNSRFVKVVLVCFVIAVPVSIVIMRRYLEGFAYQVPLHVWVFVLALLAVLAVTIAVVTLRSLRAATVNPVKSLRNE
ncbi:MAG: ABC transporter permease [Bacteroidales bacterium]|nr:ABC transporter permease [Bacteroidales bacterium]